MLDKLENRISNRWISAGGREIGFSVGFGVEATRKGSLFFGAVSFSTTAVVPGSDVIMATRENRKEPPPFRRLSRESVSCVQCRPATVQDDKGISVGYTRTIPGVFLVGVPNLSIDNCRVPVLRS